jgi:hypothetical protein
MSKSKKGQYQDPNLRKRPAMLNQKAGPHDSRRGRALRDQARAEEMEEMIDSFRYCKYKEAQ